MPLLTVNTGSSSLKCALYTDEELRVLASLTVERIGDQESRLFGRIGVHQLEQSFQCADHASALRQILHSLKEQEAGTINAIGHRVVHGGEQFQTPVRIDTEVRQAIADLVKLAPQHNPLALAAIDTLSELLPEVPQVAVFDTAFHQTLPPHCYRYPLPEPLYREHGIRRYGFHGISHGSAARRAAELLEEPLEQLNLITLHLGQGCSAAAIEGGRCVDTSMGLTPLEGLMMGRRSGSLDPALPLYLQQQLGYSAEQVEQLLNRQAGLEGVCGDHDMRTIHQRIDAGDDTAELALTMFCHSIRKQLGAYVSVLGWCDAIVFTAGIGEHDAVVRQRICENQEALGLLLDREANQAESVRARAIHSSNSRCAILVIPADEEGEIARATESVIKR